MTKDSDRDGIYREPGINDALVQWNNTMYARHPTPYGKGIAGAIQEARVRAVLSLARLTSGDSVLEIGCEGGGLLARLPPCVKIAACDVSLGALGHARERLHSLGRNVDLYHADAETSLPFAAGEFSAIICSEVLEHVASPRKVVRNIHSISTQETKVVFTVPIEWLKTRMKGILKKLHLLDRLFPSIEEGRSEWHLHAFSDRMVRCLLKGLFVVERTAWPWCCHAVYLCRWIQPSELAPPISNERILAQDVL
jgi:SAM-dependent methyltransferase